MQTTDWKVDLSVLQNYNLRDRIPYVYDEFYEIPAQNMLIVIYSVVEASMMNYTGNLAIYADKECPKLIFQLDNFPFVPNVSISPDGEFAFLTASIYFESTTETKCPLVIVDLTDKTFAYISTENHNPCFEVIKDKKDVFKIKADKTQMKNDEKLKSFCKTKIKIGDSVFYPLEKLSDLPDMI